MSLTVACVWVKGHVPFTATYVIRLYNMVRKHLNVPHDFVCLTDQPEALPRHINTIDIKTPAGYYAWWSKLELFNPEHAQLQHGRVLYLDLDVLILQDLLPITMHGVFSIVPDGAPNFVGKGALKVVKKYNSSVMCWNGGRRNELYTKWDTQVTRRLWGDQDWIGEQMPLLDVMPISWFPRMSQCEETGPDNWAKVLLCKKPKNTEAARRHEWFRDAWI